MEDTKKAVITIHGIADKYIESIGATVFTILSNQGDFQFWKNKKDGSETKAYEQFQQFRFVSGDTVEVIYKEQDASYLNKKSGKMVNKINKNIIYFAQIDENTPATPIPEHKVDNDIEKITARLDDLEKRIVDLEVGVPF